ncbi:MAG: patatin-like phospholipase family protein [Chroococcidiopsidaceae cyanobacterium CP_BM_ER_R8_30]|nr:patatin-like phospholipase family protein [Chroococcidiopsidaceae cyanobacterium CP_BM_ER_R8_30]
MAFADSKYLIISCDGGGIRGLVTAMILDRINTQFPRFLNQVNLYAGTSTGSFIALGLASGITTSNLVKLYATQGAKIFQIYAQYDTFDYVKYYNTGLYSVLSKTLPKPGQTLSNLKQFNPTQSALVTTFQLENAKTKAWSALALHNLPNSDTAAHTTLIDAAMSSSAAPTYFPPYSHPHYGYCIDGGVVANNPCTLALSMVLDPSLANIPLQNIWMLSLGTGFSVDSISDASVKRTGPMNYGVKNWMWPEASGSTPSYPLLSAIFDGIADVDTYQCQQILGSRFQRANLQLESPYLLDDWKDIHKLESKAILRQSRRLYRQGAAQSGLIKLPL